MSLASIDILIERRIARTRANAYRLVREHVLPAGVAVRIGRSVFINPERLDAFLAGGGTVPEPHEPRAAA